MEDAVARRTDRVREPVQVYLDRPDAELLGDLRTATGLPGAELLRRGIRRLAADLLTEKAPGSSFDVLEGSLGDDPSLPADLAAEHDRYLYAPPEAAKRRGKPRAR
jgi:hypothetical protein